MELTDTEKKQTDEYELDVTKTFWANIPLYIMWIVMMAFMSFFAAMMESFTLPEMRIIGAFVFAYSVIRIINILVNWDINMEYKPREKEL